MELLPSHLMKLKWLLAHADDLSEADEIYVHEIDTALRNESNYKTAHPITLVMIDGFYDTYRALENRRQNAR